MMLSPWAPFPLGRHANYRIIPVERVPERIQVRYEQCERSPMSTPDAERAQRRADWETAWSFMDKASQGEALRTAIHEAGHAVAAHHFLAELIEVRVNWTLAPNPTRAVANGGQTGWEGNAYSGFEHRAEIYLAGGCAERSILPALAIDDPWSPSDRDGAMSALAECGRSWDDAVADTDALLSTYQPAILAVAGLLLRQGTLTGNEAHRAIRRAPRQRKPA